MPVDIIISFYIILILRIWRVEIKTRIWIIITTKTRVWLIITTKIRI